MRKPVVVLTLVSAQLLVAAGAPRIVVTKVNGGAPVALNTSEKVSKFTLEGFVEGPAGDKEVLCIRAAVQEPEQDGWTILAEPVQTVVGVQAWKLSGLEFEGTWPRALRVVLLGAQRSLPPGPFDEQMLRRISLAISEPLAVLAPRRAAAARDGAPRVQFDKLGQFTLTPGLVHKVGLQETAQCRYRKPASAEVQVVVVPLEGDSFWVMHGGSGVRGTFTGNAVFGRDGLDAYKEFLVFCVLADPALPREEITRSAWEVFEKRRILAKSNDTRVIRIDRPVNPATEVKLELTNVHLRRVDPNQEWRVPERSAVAGTATGRGIAAGEKVWLFRAPQGQNDAWTMIGPGSVKNDRSWEFTPLYLGKPGQRWTLVAVLSRTKPEGIRDPRIITSSDPVKVVVFPEVTAQIDRVGQMAASEGQELHAPRVASVEVDMKSTSPTGAERVWVYRHTERDAMWTLLRRALPVAGEKYETFPSELGRSGERVTLIAVVSEERINSLDDAELARVLAFSKPVTVRIE